jgi:hypothetical protein
MVWWQIQARSAARFLVAIQIFNLLYRPHSVGKARELPYVFDCSNIPDAFGETPNAARETRALP